MLRRLQISHTTRPITVLQHWRDAGDLFLDAPYQRGDVWGDKRRQDLIYSLLVGIPIPAILINDRQRGGWGDDNFTQAVIDGRQRCQTVLAWLDNKLEVPSTWFHESSERMPHLSEVLVFADLSKIKQRCFTNLTLSFCEATLPDLEAEQRAFDLINFAGVPQGQADEDAQ